MRRFLPLLLALLIVAGSALPAWAQGNLGAAASWLESQQRADGGFSDGFSDASSVSATTDVLFAATAAGEDPSAWGDGPSPLDYLAANAASATTTGALAKLALAAHATGQDATDFGGVNLVEALQAQFDASSGLFAGTVAEHTYAMLALHNVGAAIPQGAAAALVALQDGEGGWSFDGSGQADTNTTALALQALAADEAGEGAIADGLAFLAGQQNEDGGFPYQAPSDFGTESDANSTAWVIQALLAVGESLADWQQPDAFLASLQGADGSFQWKSEVAGANFLATAQAVPALAGHSYAALPVVAASQAPRAAPAATPAAATAPQALPQAGGTLPWAMWGGAGLLLLTAGAALRRRAA